MSFSEAKGLLDSVERAPVPNDPGQVDETRTLVIELEQTVQGLAVNQPKQNIGHRNYYDYDPVQFPDGILFRRKKSMGAEPVHVVPPSWGSTVAIHHGRVRFDEGFVVHAGASSRSIVWTSGQGLPDVYLGCVGTHYVVDEKGPKWGLSFHNTRDVFVGVEIWSADSTEHARYGRGYAAEGAPDWRHCHVHSAGAECFKQANRPQEGCRWYPNQVLTIDECDFEGWEAFVYPDGGSMGGGIVLQGTGAHARIVRSRLRGPSRVPTHAIMMDDGYGTREHHEERFFDFRSGVPQPKFHPDPASCANGYLLVEDVAVEGWGRWFVPMIRVGTMGQGVQWKTAAGFLLSGSGVYGENTQVELGQIEELPGGAPAVAVAGCNTPEIREWMRANGYEADQETILQYGAYGIRQPVSDGLVPSPASPGT